MMYRLIHLRWYKFLVHSQMFELEMSFMVQRNWRLERSLAR